MKIYRGIWRTVATLLAVVGVAAATLLWSIATTLWIFGCAAVVAAAITTGMSAAHDVPPARRELIAEVTTRTVVSATAIVALFGFGALLGITGIVLVATLAASSPPAVSLCQRRFERTAPPDSDTQLPNSETKLTDAATEATRPPPTTQNDPSKHPHPPADAPVDCGAVHLDDLALCKEWSRSYWALCDTVPTPERLRIIEARQHYLDELERRHPGFVACWFAAGARPGSDPRRFLASDHDRSNPPEASR